MRRILLLASVCLLGAALPGRPAAAQGGPPHAWLFGAWTGGLFPAPENLASRSCLGQPVVIFTRDVVLRATLTDVTYTQRVIETARTNPGSTEFRFSPAASAGESLLGTAPPPAVGFGCSDPNALHVLRRSDNEITFPGCADFPYPLVRCR
jgi:hypothetical protein